MLDGKIADTDIYISTTVWLNLWFIVSNLANCATYDSQRISAYDEDLRWRMAYQIKCLGKTFSEVGESLHFDAFTVCRIVTYWESQQEEIFGLKKLTEFDKLVSLEAIIEKPSTVVDESTTCRFLHSSGFSHDKNYSNSQTETRYLNICLI